MWDFIKSKREKKRDGKRAFFISLAHVSAEKEIFCLAFTEGRDIQHPLRLPCQADHPKVDNIGNEKISILRRCGMRQTSGGNKNMTFLAFVSIVRRLHKLSSHWM